MPVYRCVCMQACACTGNVSCYPLVQKLKKKKMIVPSFSVKLVPVLTLQILNMEMKKKLHFVCWDSNSGVSCGIMKVFFHSPNAVGSVVSLQTFICIQKGIVSGEYWLCKNISTCIYLCKVLVLACLVNIHTPWLFPVFFTLTTVSAS